MTVDAQPTTHSPEKPISEKMTSINNASKIEIKDGKSANSSDNTINRISVESELKEDGSDFTWEAEISICDGPVKFLVDSGAHASMIRATKINRNTLYYPKIKYGLIGIAGPKSTVQTYGAAFGSITSCGIQIKHQFQIAGKDVYLNYDGIIGSDFLKLHKSVMDFERLKMKNTLPPWHSLYETAEREEFERKHPKLKKEIRKGKNTIELIYKEEKVEKTKNSKLNRVKGSLRNGASAEIRIQKEKSTK